MHSKLIKAGLVSLPILSRAAELGTCVEGTCEAGKGIFEYDSGDVYYGEFAGSVIRHGNGIISYNISGKEDSNAKKYDGDWHIDEYSGKGRLELIDGTVFKGKFEQNQLISGRITYPNTSWIEGNFLNSVPNGRAAWMDVDLERTSYIGDWVEGVWHGQGILEKDNGFKHNGTFVLGAMDGLARRDYPLKDSINKDNFEKNGDEKQVLVIYEPNWYEGNFIHGERHGKGIYHENVDNQKWWEWHGEFVYDQMKGEGTMIRSNGSQDPDKWDYKIGTYPWKEEWVWLEDDELDNKKMERTKDGSDKIADISTDETVDEDNEKIEM
jgi:hypothetical protein